MNDTQNSSPVLITGQHAVKLTFVCHKKQNSLKSLKMLRNPFTIHCPNCSWQSSSKSERGAQRAFAEHTQQNVCAEEGSQYAQCCKCSLWIPIDYLTTHEGNPLLCPLAAGTRSTFGFIDSDAHHDHDPDTNQPLAAPASAIGTQIYSAAYVYCIYCFHIANFAAFCVNKC